MHSRVLKADGGRKWQKVGKREFMQLTLLVGEMEEATMFRQYCDDSNSTCTNNEIYRQEWRDGRH